MCFDPIGAEGEPDGVCPDCGEDTVERISTDICGYSPTDCETCGNAPCDMSC